MKDPTLDCRLLSCMNCISAHLNRRVAPNISFLKALDFEILDFQPQDAIKSGEIRAMLAARGTPIGPSTY